MDMRESAEKKDRGDISGNGRGMGSVLLGYLKSARVGVSIHGLKKSFGDNHVLRGVDLEVRPGETAVILGKSGTGKSVMLRHIIGLEKPDAGRILIGGEDINDPDFKKNHVVSMVFQSSALFNSLSVEENVALYLKEHRVFDDEEDKAARVERARDSRTRREGGYNALHAFGRDEEEGRHGARSRHEPGPDTVRRAHLRDSTR